MYILKIEQARFQDKGPVNQTADGPSLIPARRLGFRYGASSFSTPRGAGGRRCLFFLFVFFLLLVSILLFCLEGVKGLWESETAVSALLSIKLALWPHPPSNEK